MRFEGKLQNRPKSENACPVRHRRLSLARAGQHSRLDLLNYNAASLSNNLFAKVSYIFAGWFFNLPNQPMANDAPVDHAPMNYATKLRWRRRVRLLSLLKLGAFPEVTKKGEHQTVLAMLSPL